MQVAVQHNASLDVLETLLEFCPFALCVTNPQNPVDPLSYAKRHRKNETEVIELLSRPLSYWVTERSRDPNTSMTSFYSREVEETRSPPPQPSIDRQELYNVKLLCAQVLKVCMPIPISSVTTSIWLFRSSCFHCSLTP